MKTWHWILIGAVALLGILVFLWKRGIIKIGASILPEVPLKDSNGSIVYAFCIPQGGADYPNKPQTCYNDGRRADSAITKTICGGVVGCITTPITYEQFKDAYQAIDWERLPL